jgi:hypothetical protein
MHPVLYSIQITHFFHSKNYLHLKIHKAELFVKAADIADAYLHSEHTWKTD